ncbi:MAG: DUF2254 domain-containing protein [Syntrophobacteraceae bacterium]
MRSTFSRSILPCRLIPLVYVAATIALAFTLPPFEYKFLPNLSHAMTTTSAIAIFSSIASGMIALTGIVFSLAFVMIQFSSSAYSPRLVTWFSESPTIFHSLGLFCATFIYALACLGWVNRLGSKTVPFLSTWVVIILLVCSVFALVLLIRDLSNLQVTRILQLIGHSGQDAIRKTYTTKDLLPFEEGFEDRPQVGEQASATQTLYYFGEPLIITAIDTGALVRLAKRAGGLIVLHCATGETLMQGQPLLQIFSSRIRLPESALAAPLKLGRERTFQQDSKYAIRLLVDIAIKALSPAINDPTTAVQAIDQIEDLLRRLVGHNLKNGRVRDEDGVLRLIFPTPDWDDFLSLAFDEISFYGATSLQVMRRLRATLADLSEIAEEHKKRSIQSFLEHLDYLISQSFTEKRYRSIARRQDRQGLGLSRRRAWEVGPGG